MRRVPALLTCLSLLGLGLPRSPAAQAPDPALLEQVDRAIAKVRARKLDTKIDTPWVVMHAALAFGGDATVRDAGSGEELNVVDYLLTRAETSGVGIWRNENGKPHLLTRGVDLQRSFQVQDHVDQYLMTFALAGVAPERTLTASDGTEFRVSDLVSAAQQGFDEQQELGWTLVALSHYVGFDASWQTSEGATLGVADIVKIALERDVTRETEGGTHHLFAIAWTLDRHRAAGRPEQGVWKTAGAYLARHVRDAQKIQLEDGSFSKTLFQGEKTPPASTRDALWGAGHMLEWLSLSVPSGRLGSEWLLRTVRYVSSALLDNSLVRFTDGGLYHAAHALRIWRERIGAKPQTKNSPMQQP